MKERRTYNHVRLRQVIGDNGQDSMDIFTKLEKKGGRGSEVPPHTYARILYHANLARSLPAGEARQKGVMDNSREPNRCESEICRIESALAEQEQDMLRRWGLLLVCPSKDLTHGCPERLIGVSVSVQRQMVIQEPDKDAETLTKLRTETAFQLVCVCPAWRKGVIKFAWLRLAASGFSAGFSSGFSPARHTPSRPARTLAFVLSAATTNRPWYCHSS